MQCNNQIGDEGAKAIAEALTKNRMVYLSLVIFDFCFVFVLCFVSAMRVRDNLRGAVQQPNW